MSTTDAAFAAIPPVDNFYQTCLFMPMAFALVTTVHEDGQTGIGPHALIVPFGISPPYSLLLISRSNSGTACNIRRTGKCAFNYLEFDRAGLEAIARLGLPGQALGDKQKGMPFTLITPPSGGKTPPDEAPRIIEESLQVIECTWDRSYVLDRQPASEEGVTASHFVMQVDRLLLKPGYRQSVDGGGPLPSMPIFYGFRPEGGFWFAEHSAPFAVSPPRPKGIEAQSVFYIANRLDEKIRFTREACTRFTKVPQPFLKAALLGVVEAARKHDVTLVDVDFVDANTPARGRSST